MCHHRTENRGGGHRESDNAVDSQRQTELGVNKHCFLVPNDITVLRSSLFLSLATYSWL